MSSPPKNSLIVGIFGAVLSQKVHFIAFSREFFLDSLNCFHSFEARIVGGDALAIPTRHLLKGNLAHIAPLASRSIEVLALSAINFRTEGFEDRPLKRAHLLEWKRSS